MLLLFFFFSHLHLKSEQLKFIIFPLNWIEKKNNKKKIKKWFAQKQNKKERERETNRKKIIICPSCGVWMYSQRITDWLADYLIEVQVGIDLFFCSLSF